MKLTRNSSDKSILNLDGEPTFKAASAIGTSILEEMWKYSKGENYVVPPRMAYNVYGKCWLDEKGRIAIFNISEDPKAPRYAREFLSSQSPEREIRKKDTNGLGGYVAADNGEALSVDTPEATETTPKRTKALKIDSQVAEESAKKQTKE